MSDFNENTNTEQTDKVEPSLSAAEPSPYAVPEIIEGVEQVKKKSKGTMIAIIAAVIIAILAAGSACAYAFVPSVKNSVKMLISSPENYYSWVEEQNLKGTADVVSEAYGKLLDNADNAIKEAEGELKLELDPENAAELAAEIIGTDITEIGWKIPSNLSVKYGADSSDSNNVKGTYQIAVDDNSLVSMNMYMRDGKYYYQIPELSSSYILMDIQSIMGESLSRIKENSPEAASFVEGYLNGLTSVSNGDAANMLREMLSEDELNDLIVTYFTKVFENIDNVKLEKNYSYTVNGVDGEYTKLTANIDQGTLFSALKAILTEAKDDDTIIKIAGKIGVDKDTYSSAIDGLLAQMGSLEVSGGDTVLTMNVYVNSKGVICGREISSSESSDEDISFGYMVTEKGGETAYEFKFTQDAADVIVVTGKSDKDGDKCSGNIDILLVAAADDGNDINIPITYKDIETVDEEKGYCKGEVSIDLSASDAPVISLLLDSDGSSQTVKSDIVLNNTNYGTVSMTVKEGNSIEIPEFDGSQKTYEYTEDGVYIQEYLESASENITKLMDNVGSAFGMDTLGQLLFADGFDTAGFDTDDELLDAGDMSFDNVVNDYDTSDDIKYDFSKLSLQINGQSVVVPAKINGILDLVDVPDKTVIDPNGFEIYTSGDYTLSVSVVNPTEAAAAPADCVITGINVMENAPIAFSIDGFTIGSNISDVAAKYGVKLDDTDYGYFTIYDSASDWNEISFSYAEGKVDSLGINIYE